MCCSLQRQRAVMESRQICQMTKKAEVKKKAEDFQKDAASAERFFSVFATAVGASATDLTFDSDTTSPNEDLIKAADKLKKAK